MSSEQQPDSGCQGDDNKEVVGVVEDQEKKTLETAVNETMEDMIAKLKVQEKNEKNLNNNEQDASLALVAKAASLNISQATTTTTGTSTASVILDRANSSLRSILDAYDSDESSSSSGSAASSLYSGVEEEEETNGSDSSASDLAVEFISESQGAIKKPTKPPTKDAMNQSSQFMSDLGLDTLPPVPDLYTLAINAGRNEYVHMGHVRGIIDRVITVESLANIPAYNIDTLLFYGDEDYKRPLGMVFDVIGQVTAPTYAVRFNSPQEIADAGIEKNMRVFSSPKSVMTKYVFVQELMKLKGTDASWIDDDEVPELLQEFSDDDAERAYKSKLKQNRKRPHSSQERYKRYERAMNQCNVLNSKVHQLIDAGGIVMQQQAAPSPPVLMPPHQQQPPVPGYYNVYENVRLAPWGYAPGNHPALVPYGYAFPYTVANKDGSGPSTSNAAPPDSPWPVPGAWALPPPQYPPPNDPSSLYKCP